VYHSGEYDNCVVVLPSLWVCCFLIGYKSNDVGEITQGGDNISTLVLPSLSRFVFRYCGSVVQDVGEIHRVEILFILSFSPLFLDIVGLLFFDKMSGRLHRVEM